MITSNFNVEGSHSSTSRRIDWWIDRARTGLSKSINPEGFILSCLPPMRKRWSYLGDFYLLSVIRLPLPQEGSAILAHKGSGGNYACGVLLS